MRTTSIPGAVTLVLISAGTALAASTPRPDEVPAYCAKAAAYRVDPEFDACVAGIKVPQSSPLYAGRKADCETRRSSYRSRYVAECTKQLGRSLTNVTYWPVK